MTDHIKRVYIGGGGDKAVDPTAVGNTDYQIAKIYDGTSSVRMRKELPHISDVRRLPPHLQEWQ